MNSELPREVRVAGLDQISAAGHTRLYNGSWRRQRARLVNHVTKRSGPCVEINHRDGPLALDVKPRIGDTILTAPLTTYRMISYDMAGSRTNPNPPGGE